MSVVTLSINGQPVSARADETILQATREAGIAIPTLCYGEGLSAHAGCRLCLVEVAGSPRGSAKNCWSKRSSCWTSRKHGSFAFQS